MQEIGKIKTFGDDPLSGAAAIIDKSGRIIAMNSELKKVLPSASPQGIFFDLFDEFSLAAIQKIFIDTRKYDARTKDVIEIKEGKVPANYEISFTPLKSENNVYFLVEINSGAAAKKTESKKFYIATSELEKIVDDKRIISIINKIKLTYPFTFIEKAKIQKEIDELTEFFWLKESNGKFVLVNEAYARSLGFTPVQLENKPESDFLPKYLVSLYNTVNQYIIESGNTVFFEGISTPVSSNHAQRSEIVEFPICDLDNNVVAIIGFSRKREEVKVSALFGMNESFVHNFPEPILFLDAENKIICLSAELIKLFALSTKKDYKGLPLQEIFEKEFVEKIDSFVKSAAEKETAFGYTFKEKANLFAEIQISKIFDGDSFIGSQIYFKPKNSLQIQLETKAYLYDSFLQHSTEAFFIYDLETLKFLEVNDAALKLYGYKRTDFLNMDLTDLYAPEDIQTLIQSGDNKGQSSGLWRHKTSDGSSILVELVRNTIDFKGRKAHLNIVRNISEQISEKIKNQILQATYDNTSDSIIITDKDGFIQDINDNVSRKIGYSKKELENRPFISLVSDDERAKVNKNIFHSGLLKTSSIEVDIKKSSGNLNKAIVIATPIKNLTGDLEAFSLLIKLSEEKPKAADIKHSIDDSEENVDPPFLSNMFHEILTPINVILGFTQELWESIPEPSEEQKEAVDIIKENQKLLLQIMDNAVEYSTLLQKIIRFKPEELKFTDLLDEIKENTRKTSESHKVEFALGKISSSLLFDSDRQKLISLVSLFVKFAIHITKESTIYLSAYNYDDKNFIVSIKDTRSNITPYLLKGLNDVFSDEESVTRRNYGFSRFSVRLSKRLVELLSARKEIITKENEPVEFGLLFPNKFVIVDKEKTELESEKPVIKHETKVVQQMQAEEPPKISVVKQKELDLTQLSCLYLEDQVDSQILFKNQMRDLKGIEVAPSFETALPLLKTKRFDFIIMDINLQGEYNGLDALRIVQKMPGFKDVPVIASTAYMQPGARENFKAAGFTDFISKPLLREKVIAVLKSIFIG